MDAKSLENFPSESYANSKELTIHLDRINALSPGQRYEFILPESSNICAFVSQVSLLPYKGEFSGVGDIFTGSIIVQKGYETGSGTSALGAHSDYIEERIKPGNVIDDIVFHTHPFNPNDATWDQRNPAVACLPSESTDMSNIVYLRRWAERNGLEWRPVMIIGSHGALSITEATGIRVDDARLREIGLTINQINAIKESVQLYPPIYFKNYGYYKDKRGDELVEKGIALYEQLSRVSDRKEIMKILNEFVQQNYELFRTESDREGTHFSGAQFIEDFWKQPIKYPTSGRLYNLGLSRDQQREVRSMLGVTIESYTVDGNRGLTQVSSSK